MVEYESFEEEVPIPPWTSFVEPALFPHPSLCCRVCLAKHSITDKDSRFFVTLTNVFLGFLAIIDFPFEFRCFQWLSLIHI